MKLKAIETERKYAIEGMSDSEFMLIEKLDQRYVNSEIGAIPLYKLIEKIDGVCDVDYNPHFGATIFVTVEKKDCNLILDKIKTVIKNYIKNTN